MEYLSALATAVQLKAYTRLKEHRPGVLAKMIGVTKAQESEGLKVLVEAGLLYTKEKKDWKKTLLSP